MTAKVVDVPLDGEPAPTIPRLATEHERGGLRAIVLPPGSIEVNHAFAEFMVDLNFSHLTHEIGWNSDCLAKREIPANSLGFCAPGTTLKLRVSNAAPGILIAAEKEQFLALAHEEMVAVPLEWRVIDYERDAPSASLGYLLFDALSTGESGSVYVESLVTAALARAMWWTTHPQGLWKTAPVSGTRRRINQAIDFIESHLDRDISLADIAGVACMSSFHFSRAFKAETGSAPYQYVLQRRVDRAKVLLASTSLSVAEIGYRVGIADQSRFTRTFKSVTGLTPSHYRSAVRS